MWAPLKVLNGFVRRGLPCSRCRWISLKDNSSAATASDLVDAYEMSRGPVSFWFLMVFEKIEIINKETTNPRN